ncbi:mannosyltransferase family protein [Leifsonia sp. NPDC056665]|uniref:mannosyltransferase family protein n=1 Tax=Leifsonia sp. NPDC056665 TaxID=3345901 RepID=UPI0036A7354D
MTSTRTSERPLALGTRLAARLRSRAVVVPVTLWTVAHAAIVGWALVVRAAVLVLSGHAAAVSPAALFFHWDSVYFGSIAQHGYVGPGTGPTWSAFFPGYPAAARVALAAVGFPHPDHQQVVIALEAVAAIASLAASLLVWRLAHRHYGDRVAVAATVLFVLGPYAVFLVAPYSEALFVAFALGAWLCAERGRWWEAGALAACASATRIDGVFLIAGLAVAVAVRLHSRGEPFLLKAFGTAAIGSAGILGYWAALWAWTGNPTAWFTAQHTGWHRALTWPWITLRDTVESVFVPPWPHGLQNALDLVFAALIVTALIVFIRRRQWAAVTYVGLTALAMMTSTTYLSIARSTVVLFPLTLLVATTVGDDRRRWIFRTVLAAGLVLLALNTALFVNAVWVD